MKFTSVVAIGLPSIVEEPHRQAELQARRLLHRHVDVDLEACVLVDRRQHRRLRHAVADADRNVADDAGGRRGDAVVAELDPLLADLLLDRLELRLGRLHGGVGLLELLLADGAGVEQRLRALGLLSRKLHVGLARRAHATRGRHRRLLRAQSISISTAPRATR